MKEWNTNLMSLTLMYLPYIITQLEARGENFLFVDDESTRFHSCFTRRENFQDQLRFVVQIVSHLYATLRNVFQSFLISFLGSICPGVGLAHMSLCFTFQTYLINPLHCAPRLFDRVACFRHISASHSTHPSRVRRKWGDKATELRHLSFTT